MKERALSCALSVSPVDRLSAAAGHSFTRVQPLHCAWFLLLIIQATFESTLLRVAIYITLNNVRSIVNDSKMAKDNSDALVSSASPSC
jgi:hypothetical protein